MNIEQRKLHRLAIAALAAFAFAAGPAVADVLLPYGGQSLPDGTPGYKYAIVDTGITFPGVESPAFDDSLWADGVAPFGGLGGEPPTICPDIFGWVKTSWDQRDSDIFVRFHLDLCAGVHTVRLGVSIDNDVALWVNGYPVPAVGTCDFISPDGLCVTENCAFFDKVTFDIPDAYLHAGDNLFVLQARDRGIVSYLDIQVTGDTTDATCDPEPNPNSTPTCDNAFADPGQLWPPNHKWNSIAISGPNDPDGDEIAVTITGIYQDEPIDANGNGDGKTCPDGDGVGTDTAWVRAERAGGADGRVYHIGFEATDPEGASCQGSVAVCVPHDQGGGSQCIDQGPLYDSTVCP